MSPGIPIRLLATQSDERLLALVRQGHERAFEALVQRYRKPLLSYCRRLSLPHARAEDIVQLALLKTWIAVREDAEVRDLKAWLYRVVHNTAVNALRDAAHDGEPLADPARVAGSRPPTEESQLDRGLAMREALAEVAALPPLQREVIVRTAVAGHSHEQVASDLGITHGAVRGLLYRARTTLRGAVTALTPPPLLAWLAGRSDQSAPAPERLTELAGGGGAAGFGGLLLKGGVVAITAGTVITGAAVVHLSRPAHHRDRHKLVAVTRAVGTGAGSSSAGVLLGAQNRESSVTGSRSHRGARTPTAGSPRALGTKIGASTAGGPAKGVRTVPGAGRTPRSTARAPAEAHRNAPGTVRIVQTVSPPSSSGPGQPAGSPPGGEAGAGSQAGGSEPGAGSGAPVGTAAGNGFGSGGAGSPEQGSHEGSGASSGAGQPGAGSGSSSSENSNSAGSSGSSEPSGALSKEQPGSLVGTVVHEVVGILKHVLH